MSKSTRKSQQTGVALVMVLLVVALATTAAVAMISRQQIDIRRTENILHADQAYLYALGAEDWARRFLVDDANRNQADHLGEPWAVQLPPMPIEGGSVMGRLEELHSRFNLNNLVAENGLPSERHILQFQRLLQVLDLPPTLAQAVADWIDLDQEPLAPYGAEDLTYLRSNFGYRTPNTRIRDIGELRLLAGMEETYYQVLRQHVWTLPTYTRVNVNTATPQVLMALIEGLDSGSAERLVEQRADEPFTNLQAFLAHEMLAGLGAEAADFGVKSEYFLLHAHANVGRGRANLFTLMFRQGSQVWVLGRSQSI
ncbi:MAG: type II secretion system minor pseudopilin GspK [Pseudomonadota bacterium]